MVAARNVDWFEVDFVRRAGARGIAPGTNDASPHVRGCVLHLPRSPSRRRFRDGSGNGVERIKRGFGRVDSRPDNADR